MRMPRVLAVIAVVVAIAACDDRRAVEPAAIDLAPPAPTVGAPVAPPTEPAAAAMTEAEVAAIGDRLLALMEQVVTAVEASGSDCEAMLFTSSLCMRPIRKGPGGM